MDNDSLTAEIHRQVEQIRDVGCQAQGYVDSLRSARDRFRRNSEDWWVRQVFSDALNRLAIIASENFFYIESLSLLATARYVFELLLWLELLEHDPKYSLLYWDRLLENKESEYRQVRLLIDHEIEIYEEAQRRSDRSFAKSLAEVKAGRDIADVRKGPEIFAEIDDWLTGQFTIRAGVEHTGYSGMAEIIRTQELPVAETRVREIQEHRREFEESLSKPSKRDLSAMSSKWKKMAAKVGREREYDYLYSYCSRMLHALPASITTTNQRLRPEEQLMLVRHCRVRLQEAVALAERL